MDKMTDSRAVEAQAQGGGEAVYQLADEYGHYWLDCSKAVFKWWQGKDRKSRKLYAAPPSAPVGVEGLVAKWRGLANDALRRSGTWGGNDIADRIEFMADELEALTQQPAAVDEVEGLKRLVRHLTCNPDFDFAAALAAQPGGSDNDR